VFSITQQGFIVHWPRSSLPGNNHGSTEILESSGMTESVTNRVSMHAKRSLFDFGN
jgi:hypothetical protein